MGKVFKGVGKVVGKVVKPVKGVFTSALGEELGNAAFMAAAAYLGGAGLTALGGSSALAGSALGNGLATVGGAVGSGTGAAIAGAGGYQQGAANVAAEKQEAANVAAESRANEALRQQEIMRKTALLAEQRTLSSRVGSARNVRNNISAINSKKLGDEEETLG